jgi:hypothetical protein
MKGLFMSQNLYSLKFVTYNGPVSAESPTPNFIAQIPGKIVQILPCQVSLKYQPGLLPGIEVFFVTDESFEE